MGLIGVPNPEDAKSVRLALRKLATLKLGPTSTPTFGSLTLGDLTAGRVLFAGTGGLITDDADLTFSVDTLTVPNVVISGAGTSSIDGTEIGANTAAAGTFTNLVATADLTLGDDVELRFGSAVTGDYALFYSSSGTAFALKSANIDGVGSPGNIFTVQDGTNDITFMGDLTLSAGTLTAIVSGSPQLTLKHDATKFATFEVDGTGILTIDTFGGQIAFSGDNFTGVGTIASGDITVDSDLVFSSGSITSVSDAINFGNEALSTTGSFSSGAITTAGILSINQVNDTEGIYLTGYDDRNDKHFKIYIDGLGNSVIDSTSPYSFSVGGTNKMILGTTAVLFYDNIKQRNDADKIFYGEQELRGYRWYNSSFFEFVATPNPHAFKLTGYTSFQPNCDTFWVGDGTGLPYGHMYVDGTQVIRVALTINTPAEVEGDGTGGTATAEDGWLAGDLNLMTFPTGGTEHHVTITKAGIYHITWNLSFKMVTGAANTQIHAGLAIDSTTFRRDRCEAHRTISNNSDTGNMSGSCMIDLPNGNEELSLWMENTTNSNDADVSHGSLTVVMVGGT